MIVKKSILAFLTVHFSTNQTITLPTAGHVSRQVLFSGIIPQRYPHLDDARASRGRSRVV